MKRFLTIIFLFYAFLGNSQQTYVPNDNFEAYLEANGMGNGITNDDYVLTAAIDTLTLLNVSGISIQSMTGIEDFIALEELRCNNCSLDSLGLYNNPSLSYLDCGNNDLLILNVSSCTSLETLICNGYGAQLLSLDLSQNAALKYLDCNYQLNSLLLAPTVDLNFLDYSYNDLGTALNVSQMPSLITLLCSGNGLSTIDISQNPALEMFIGNNNQFTTLDVTQNLLLNYLDCSQNDIDSINVTQNSLLTMLYCSGNLLNTVDVSQNPALYTLDCSYNLLSDLNVSQNSQLKELKCQFSTLPTLDVTQNPALIKLFCFGNPINTLDVSQNLLLAELNCMTCQLTSLYVGNNALLETLYCQDNYITSLDLSSNSSLYTLIASDNDLYCLNVKNGFNIAMPNALFNATYNPNLSCIEVDDAAWSTANWTFINGQSYFSEDCSAVCAWGIDEITIGSKELVRIVDVLGRETTLKPNIPLIYIYSDGSTERVMNLEE